MSAGVICCYGEAVVDLIAVIAEPLPMDGQVKGSISTRPGGSAHNVARAAARSGAQVRFIGRIGNGAARDVWLASLRDAGVEIEAVDGGGYTTALGIQLPNGDAVYVTDDEHAQHLTPSDVERSWLNGAAVVHVSGYDIFDVERFPAAERLITLAHEAGVPVSLDISMTTGLLEWGIERFTRWLAEVARPVLIGCNEAEGDLLALDRSFPAGVGTVIQHRSTASTRVFTSGGRRDVVPLEDTERYADTIGAGDAFTGAMLAEWVRTGDVLAAVALGHREASRHLRSLDRNVG